MKPDQDGDCIIRDDSGSFVSFSRDISKVKKRLGIPIINTLQLCAVILVLIVIPSTLIPQGNNTGFSFFITEILGLAVLAILIISGMIIRNKLILKKTCTTFTIYNDKINIDGNEFELSKIKSAFMTPFEYYEKRYVCFEYKNKKYRYYFGKFKGLAKSELFYKPYVQMTMLLESRGFSNKY